MEQIRTSQPSMNAPLLDIRDLQIHFHTQKGQLEAVRGVNFSLYPGEIVGLVGESGCGKSLTAYAIVKLLPAARHTLSGEIAFEGQNLLLKSEKEMRSIRGKDIGLVCQDPAAALNPTRRIGDQLVEGLIHHRHLSKQSALAKGIEWLEKLGIGDAACRMRQYPHEVSGGMKQRILIGMALATHPSILIADEPTTALDATIQVQILELLKIAKQEQKTSILLITHDLGVVASCCDRLLVMYAGQIVESGSVEDLFKAPQHPYTQALLQARRSLIEAATGPLFTLPGSPPLLLNPSPGCTFANRCPHTMRICQQKQPALEKTLSQGQVACWLKEKEKR